MMAPTELLAEQHYRVIKRWLEPLGINVIFLAGNVKGRARKLALESIANGDAQIVLGTHALFEQDVAFSKLALVVVDEQHRFGVSSALCFAKKACDRKFPTSTHYDRDTYSAYLSDVDLC